MKHKIYQYAIYTVLIGAAVFSVFLILSDNIAPFTTQASMHKTVAHIAPETSGVITHVNVTNGQHVEVGTLLFSIDKASYQLAVQQAKAQLHQAEQNNSAKWQQLRSAEQTLDQRKLQYGNAKVRLGRALALQKKGLIAEQIVDDNMTKSRVAEKAVDVAKAGVLRLKAELAGDKNSAAIELAQSNLQLAELNLRHTDIFSSIKGSVSNLQLQAGSYINKGTTALLVVNEANTWLRADFNEKGLSHLTLGTPVIISFDALPGQLFDGKIISLDRAIYDASSKDSQLAKVVSNNRWIRGQQKLRTRIQVNNANPALISGSRASVIVINGNPVVDALSYSWMKFVSYFHYIY